MSAYGDANKGRKRISDSQRHNASIHNCSVIHNYAAEKFFRKYLLADVQLHEIRYKATSIVYKPSGTEVD